MRICGSGVCIVICVVRRFDMRISWIVRRCRILRWLDCGGLNRFCVTISYYISIQRLCLQLAGEDHIVLIRTGLLRVEMVQ